MLYREIYPPHNRIDQIKLNNRDFRIHFPMHMTHIYIGKNPNPTRHCRDRLNRDSLEEHYIWIKSFSQQNPNHAMVYCSNQMDLLVYRVCYLSIDCNSIDQKKTI